MGPKCVGVHRDVDRLEPDEVAVRQLDDLLPQLLVTQRRGRLDELREQVEHLVLDRRDRIRDLAVRDSNPLDHRARW